MSLLDVWIRMCPPVPPLLPSHAVHEEARQQAEQLDHGELQALPVHVRPVQEQDWAKVLSSNFGADLSTFYEQDIKNHIARYCVTQTFHFDSNFYLVGTSRARAMYASSMRGHCTKFTTFKDFSYQDGQVAKGKQNWPVDQVEVKKWKRKTQIRMMQWSQVGNLEWRALHLLVPILSFLNDNFYSSKVKDISYSIMLHNSIIFIIIIICIYKYVIQNISNICRSVWIFR